MKRFRVQVGFEVEAQDDCEQTALGMVEHFVAGQEFWPVGIAPAYIASCGEILDGEAHGDDECPCEGCEACVG